MATAPQALDAGIAGQAEAPADAVSEHSDCGLAAADHSALLHFEVQDSGDGIAPAVLARLFEPFSQGDNSTTRRHGGTGLGLLITRRLARLMGGDAGASSTPGVGSRFWFEVRLRPGAPRPELAPAAQLEDALRTRAAGRRVLIADDHPVSREVTAEMLGSAAMQVELAVDGQEAVDLVARCQPGRGYDLVLMDMQMPRLDGLGATRAIRRLPQGADLPIIAMTANAFSADRAACLAAGMNDFISKPVDLQALYSALLRWLPATPSAAPVEAAQRPGEPAASALDTAAPTSVDDDLAWHERLLATPGLDVTRGMYQVRGRLPAYLHVLGVFLHSLRKVLVELQTWQTEHDTAISSGSDHRPPIDTLGALVHRIKGSAGAVGAMNLHHSAASAESLIRQGGTPDLRPVILALITEATAMAQALDLTLDPTIDRPRE